MKASPLKDHLGIRIAGAASSAPASIRGQPLTTQAPRMLFLGSFPPRECGIATFMKDVVDSYEATLASRGRVTAIAGPGGEDRVSPDQVVGRLVQVDRDSYLRTAELVDAY